MYLIVLSDIAAIPQINLYYTDWVSDGMQHNCLRVAAQVKEDLVSRQIISYCMGELPSNFVIEKSDVHPKFTFVQLLKENIISEQLYLWLASIDVTERYQFYLNEVST